MRLCDLAVVNTISPGRVLVDAVWLRVAALPLVMWEDVSSVRCHPDDRAAVLDAVTRYEVSR